MSRPASRRNCSASGNCSRRTPRCWSSSRTPNIKHEGKRKALSDLFQGRVHPLVLNTLITLSDQDRAGRVLNVSEEFSADADGCHPEGQR